MIDAKVLDENESSHREQKDGYAQRRSSGPFVGTT